jgi:hypothetical protein
VGPGCFIFGIAETRPKTYDLRLPTFLIRIATFQDGYRPVAGLWAARSVAPWKSYLIASPHALGTRRAAATIALSLSLQPSTRRAARLPLLQRYELLADVDVVEQRV